MWVAAAAALGALLAGPASAQTDQEMLEWADGFESVHAAAPRRPNEGDHISPFGTILDTPSCLGGIDEGALRKVTREFDTDMVRTLRQVRACSEENPELQGLLSDALAVLRRSVVRCDPTRRNAGAYANPIQGPGTPDSHGRVFGAARQEHSYYISLAQPGLIAFHAREGMANRPTVYLHEALHYTGANSRADHNEVEQIRYDANNPCVENRLDDRIVFLTAVCGFERDASRADIIARMSAGKCGPRRGCVRPLTLVDESFWDAIHDPHMYGRVFGEREAGIFCGRFRDRRMDAAQTRVRGEAAASRLLAARDWLGREGSTLLTESPTPPARYLAGLSPEARARVSAAPAFSRVGLLCRADRWGGLDPVQQPFDCPLNPANPLGQDGAPLAGYANQEAELAQESRRIIDELAISLKGVGGTPPSELASQVRAIFGRLCPEPDPGGFRPRLCVNGRTIMLEAAQAVGAAR